MKRIKNWLRLPTSLWHYDWILTASVLALSAVGIFLIERLEPGLGKRQLAGAGLGLFAMVTASLVNYRNLCRYMGNIAYFITLLMLLMVNIMGAVSGGAARWLEIGGFRFQPSELGKVLLILFFSEWFMERKDKISQWQCILPTAGLMVLPVASILEEPDLSTAMVVVWIFLCMWFAAGLDYRVIAKILVAVLPELAGAFVLMTFFGHQILNDYQYRRIMAWLNPDEWSAESYQQLYSVMAIGSGRSWGTLRDQREQVSIIGSGFLPEPHTDFIMAAAGQELGFAGCSVILLLWAVIVFRCLWRGMKCRDLSGRLLCVGMAAWIGGQGFVNLGVVTGMLPNTGLTLPFVSYGLTSLVSLYIGVGMVLGVSWHSNP